VAGAIMEFLLATMSRPALGATQPPIRWLSGALSPGVRQPGCEANNSPPSTAKLKTAWSYISIPQCLYGIVLK